MSTERGATAPEPVVLADGRDAIVRLSVPADRVGLQKLFDETSADNLYTRFFGIGGDTVSKHLDHLFAQDPSVLTFVVTCGERVLGVADVELLDTETAEIAFLVADDAHGCGVATLLLERAAADARTRGIAWFVADVLAINHLMLQVFADIGFALQVRREGSAVSVRMSTTLDPTARAAAADRAAKARSKSGQSHPWPRTHVVPADHFR